MLIAYLYQIWFKKKKVYTLNLFKTPKILILFFGGKVIVPSCKNNISFTRIDIHAINRKNQAKFICQHPNVPIWEHYCILGAF